MPAPAIIHVALMRPIVLDSPTGEQAAGFEIVAKNGDQFLVPLSGEGMKGLIEDTRLLLEEPHTSREFRVRRDNSPGVRDHCDRHHRRTGIFGPD